MTCPGCGGPTQELTICRGSGASSTAEKHPAWCKACVQAKVVAARAVPPYHCDDAEHRHAA